MPGGPFGLAIRGIRQRFGITPVTQLPSPEVVKPLGGVDLRSYPPLVPKRGHLKKNATFDASDPNHLKVLYCELSLVHERRIPEECRDGRVLGWSWCGFLIACVFYDPPDTRLMEFAAYDDPPSDPAPIRTLHEVVEEVVYAERRLWIETIVEIERHHIDPASIEGSRLIAEVWDRNPRLENQRHAAWEAVQHRRYIEVDEYTTEDDVRRAFRMIAATREGKHKESSRGGRPWRDPLIAVQCALLHRRHNEQDPQDRRRKKWTYKKLAEKFELASAGAAEAHVKRGCELLEENPQLEE